MDTYALIILAIGIGLYFYSRKDKPQLKSLSYFVIGFGGGLLTGAITAAVMITQAFR